MRFVRLGFLCNARTQDVALILEEVLGPQSAHCRSYPNTWLSAFLLLPDPIIPKLLLCFFLRNSFSSLTLRGKRAEHWAAICSPFAGTLIENCWWHPLHGLPTFLTSTSVHCGAERTSVFVVWCRWIWSPLSYWAQHQVLEQTSLARWGHGHLPSVP